MTCHRQESGDEGVTIPSSKVMNHWIDAEEFSMASSVEQKAEEIVSCPLGFDRALMRPGDLN
jgi:hypothetical protein